MEEDIYELQKRLKETNTEFIFSGMFSQGLIEELGQAIRQRLKLQKAEKSKISSVFFTFVEQTQNIKQYELSKENTEHFSNVAGSGVITISRNGDGYRVNSGNVIVNEDIDGLKRELDKITAMNLDELNTYFREVSRKDINMENGKVGLGLIQIARKAVEKVKYKFEKINDKYSYYIVTVRI